jgi:hypothetical protein
MGMSDAEFARQFVAATRRGEERLDRDPRSIGVRYDRRTRKVVIDLDNGCTLLVPPELAEGLTSATAAELAQVCLLGPGTTIAWPGLDVQFSVAGLLAGIFGTRAWMAELGRSGGRVRSAAKSRAARQNGANGGRPRKAKGKSAVGRRAQPGSVPAP